MQGKDRTFYVNFILGSIGYTKYDALTSVCVWGGGERNIRLYVHAQCICPF